MNDLTASYDFHLPEDRIARYPAEKREQSRMLVVHRSSGKMEHRTFQAFASYLSKDDLVVLNNAKVIPARLFSDDGKVELLVTQQESPLRWIAMVKPGKKMRAGALIALGGVSVRVIGILENGERVLELASPVDIEGIGKLPLPPYFRREEEPSDRERYQTVFATVPGAIAAPTAGLHFTPEILKELNHAFLTLHVGAGTFLPVKTDRIQDHSMHSERYEITAENAARINQAKRVVAIGTTVVRVLEACQRDSNHRVVAQTGCTDIFIYPPRKISSVEALLTNFHLPKSTLLMLVSAFAGRELIMDAYHEALREGYRFYSYGDCMLILP